MKEEIRPEKALLFLQICKNKIMPINHRLNCPYCDSSKILVGENYPEDDYCECCDCGLIVENEQFVFVALSENLEERAKQEEFLKLHNEN